MANDYCRTMREIVTRYQFEPDLRDIFVEGSDDKAIIEGILEERGVAEVSVFEISSVDVPSEPGEDSGCRARVVRLSEALAEAFRGNEPRVVCVIDSDLDHATGCGGGNAFLHKTDYADMEMYFCTSDVFKKLNRQCLRDSKLTDYMIEAFLEPTLRALFVIRCVNADDEWHLESFEFRRVVYFDRGRFRFAQKEYVERYLSKNSRLRDRQEFLAQIEAVELPNGLDPRCFMKGKDFLSLLRFMLNKLQGRSIFGSNEVMFNCVRACANYQHLADESMFATILKRLA